MAAYKFIYNIKCTYCTYHVFTICDDVRTFIKIHFIGSLFSIGKEEWIGQVSASEVKQCGKYSCKQPDMRINEMYRRH